MAVNNVTQATELMKMEQYTSSSNHSSSSNKQHQPSSSTSDVTVSDSLSGLDIFGQIVEAMPTTIPTVVESINNRDMEIIEGSKECK